MREYSLTHVSDADLLGRLDALVARDRRTTAALVAHLAEVDARELHRAAGCESMHDYCVGRLRLSEDAAYKRIQAARAARRYPALFAELAAGRLNLSGVCLLAPQLSTENADELIAAAQHRSNAGIRQFLAARFAPASSLVTNRQLEVRLPRVAAQQVPLPPATLSEASTPASRADQEPHDLAQRDPEPDSGPLEFEMRFTITRGDHERFLHARALLSHEIPSGGTAAVFRRAIEAVIAQCERRKCAATERPRAAKAGPGRGRRIPAKVRRAVWRRDDGRCAFVLPSGHVCRARRFLEFDHVVPIARGGPSTEGNVRLLCRAHNQEGAKRAFGSRFMDARRRQAAGVAAERRAPWSVRMAAVAGSTLARGP